MTKKMTKEEKEYRVSERRQTGRYLSSQPRLIVNFKDTLTFGWEFARTAKDLELKNGKGVSLELTKELLDQYKNY